MTSEQAHLLSKDYNPEVPKKMKILFLDIDGVLNTYANCMTHLRLHPDEELDLTSWKMWDPHSITALRFIQDAIPDLKIVIHSTWRRSHDVEKFKMLFLWAGLNPDQVHDITNDGPKPQSIQDYVKEHPVENYIILDDKNMMKKEKQVFINSNVGITFGNVNTVCEAFEVRGQFPVIMF